MYKIKEGEKNVMTHIKIILNLIELTKFKKCDWIRIDALKKHLRKVGISLNDIDYLHSYLKYLQDDRFIFDCESTYVTVFENIIYVFSRNKYSYDYRLDMFSIDGTLSNWEKLNSNISLLLRLRNAIIITDFDKKNDYDSFLASISQCSSA